MPDIKKLHELLTRLGYHKGYPFFTLGDERALPDGRQVHCGYDVTLECFSDGTDEGDASLAEDICASLNALPELLDYIDAHSLAGMAEVKDV